MTFKFKSQILTPYGIWRGPSWGCSAASPGHVWPVRSTCRASDIPKAANFMCQISRGWLTAINRSSQR